MKHHKFDRWGFRIQHRKLNEQKNIPVKLANCEVKPARQGEGHEVMLKSSTQIKQSPKDVASLKADIATVSKAVTLSSLGCLDELQKVIVNIQVVELKDKTKVGGRVKRDVSAADGSGRPRVSGICQCDGKRSKLLPEEFHGSRISKHKISPDGQGRFRNHPH